ncbi:MAG TPA: hypothetical protein VFL41_07010 [Gaiellaceae bacterium]|nr:hypothetical protein [Gaiellaceae bacterium]
MVGMLARRPMAAPGMYSLYEDLPRVGQTEIYDDHDVRLVWHVRGRAVYLEPPPDRDLLRLLVVLTEVVPAP